MSVHDYHLVKVCTGVKLNLYTLLILTLNGGEQSASSHVTLPTGNDPLIPRFGLQLMALDSSCAVSSQSLC
jgi:hypothetical protein